MLGKVLYGVLFVAVVPAGLVWWADAIAPAVPLPALAHPCAGGPLAVFGAALMAAGMTALVRHGRGLPMNAYPPHVYVDRGIYRLTPHPIYLGFVLTCFGISLFLQSPSGLWFVSPVVALALAALVLGFERHDLRRRFGAQAIHTPVISLPPDRPDAVTTRDRVSVYLLVALPWAVAFESVCRLGIPRDAVVAALPFERAWPVLEWTQAIYGSTYLFVLTTPFVVRTQRDLRAAAVTGLVATAAVILFYLTVPVISPPRPFEPRTILGEALMLERAACHTVAAFPAFHVIWSLIAARAWAARSRVWGAAGSIWAGLIAITCVTTGMHALADIVAAIVAFVALSRYGRIWELMRRAAEAAANSWREWRWGGVRLLNYGVYAALAAAVSVWISTALGGSQMFWPLMFVHACGLVGAGLWGQQLEGSSKLARPFGYYGSVLGVAAGVIIAGGAAGHAVLLLALVAMAAPWVQAIGRVRCLVQGCCHGSDAPEGIGIRYRDARSRVLTLANRGGVPLHPTPLYSMLANVAIGAILLRLWSLGAALSLIAGTYLLLAGIARFVEESYRGEPQTLVVGGLRLYQWLAVVSAVAGVVLTTVPGARAPGFAVAFDARVWLSGVVFGILVGFAMGVDFPGSARRFARLAPS